MHLRNVEIFCDVVNRRSFSKAAEDHNVSQSSASQSVHLLEKRLGVELIDRSKRPFELTPAGKIYYEGCRNFLKSFQSVEDRIQEMNNKVSGRLNIASIYSVGLLQMSDYVGKYRELYPDVDLRLNYLHSDDIYHQIIEEHADIGLVSFPKDNSEVSSIPWQEQPMVLVTDPQHPLTTDTSVASHQIAQEDFVGFESSLPIRKNIDRWLRQEKIDVHIVHEFDNVENIKRAVEIGAGVAILPAPTVRRELKIGSLRMAEFEDVSWFRPLGIIHKRHKTLSNAADKFVELIHEEIDLSAEENVSEPDSVLRSG